MTFYSVSISSLHYVFVTKNLICPDEGDPPKTTQATSPPTSLHVLRISLFPSRFLRPVIHRHRLRQELLLQPPQVLLNKHFKSTKLSNLPENTTAPPIPSSRSSRPQPAPPTSPSAPSTSKLPASRTQPRTPTSPPYAFSSGATLSIPLSRSGHPRTQSPSSSLTPFLHSANKLPPRRESP